MDLKQLTSLLTKAGSKAITSEMVEEDIRNGAPANGDRTVNLVPNSAWLPASSK
jgi:hypothetical protein